MNLLVLQHETVEHPGIFRSFLAEDGHTYDAVELQLGEALPSLDCYDALWVMGGPMDVWQEDAHPWLIAEKAFIREAVVDRGMPYLGLCLGHQLLACALGGEVGPGTPEIGLMPVTVTESPKSVFAGLPDEVMTLQWHGAEVTALPESAASLATSPDCSVQAMIYGARAVSAQFHLEIEPETVAAWAQIPEYAAALESALGAGAVPALEAAAAAQMDALNQTARRFYNNWMALAQAGQSAAAE
ncbi:MAG: type 1 glutamine amidotransferase [Pseudomonadota bacterium]